MACQLNYDSLSFRFEGIVWSDFHDGSVGIPAFVREGQNVHIKATVDKYNPDQFEILGIDRPLVEEITGKVSRFKINGKEIYARIVIKNKRL